MAPSKHWRHKRGAEPPSVPHFYYETVVLSLTFYFWKKAGPNFLSLRTYSAPLFGKLLEFAPCGLHFGVILLDENGPRIPNSSLYWPSDVSLGCNSKNLCEVSSESQRVCASQTPSYTTRS